MQYVFEHVGVGTGYGLEEAAADDFTAVSDAGFSKHRRTTGDHVRLIEEDAARVGIALEDRGKLRAVSAGDVGDARKLAPLVGSDDGRREHARHIGHRAVEDLTF